MTSTDTLLRGAIVAAVLSAGMVIGTPTVHAENFVLRVSAGLPAAPLSPVNQMNKTFVPRVAQRVAAETEHTIEFIEGYGGTINKPGETLETVQKGIADFGVTCACFEPTKLLVHNINYFIPFLSGDPRIMGPATRQVQDEYDFFNKAFDDFDQIYLGGGPWDDYGLGTKFPWTKMQELKGVKIGGAGPNLPWLDYAGTAKVQTNLSEAYNALQSGVYNGIVLFPGTYAAAKLGEVGRNFTTVGWGSVLASPVSVNKTTWARLPDNVKTIIKEEMAVYEQAVIDESVTKFSNALANLSAQGVTVRDLDAGERGKMARAIEPWVNIKAGEFEAKGVPGKAVFRRLIELSQEKGAKPVYVYEIK
ncbi:MAG: TRAP transporter substrate-binding protein DctP [Alphaproteobacteria bacterium]